MMKIDAAAIADHLRDLVLAEEARMELERISLKKRGSRDIPAHIGGIGGENITKIGEITAWAETSSVARFAITTETDRFVISISRLQEAYLKLPKQRRRAKDHEEPIRAAPTPVTPMRARHPMLFTGNTPAFKPDSELWPC